MTNNHLNKIKLSSLVGVLGIICVIAVFSQNLFFSSSYIYGQITFYWITFAVAVIMMIMRRKVSYTELVLTFFAIFIVTTTMINQGLSFSQLIKSFGFMTWWIWVYIIFRFIWYSTSTGGVVYLNIVTVFSIAIAVYFLFTYNSQLQLQNWGYVNNAYYCLCALPLICLIKKNIIKNISIVICVISVLVSMKRAGIISLGLILVSCIIYKIRFEKRFALKSIVLIAIFLLFTVGYNYIIDIFNIDFLRRFDDIIETGGNGRADIYKVTWNNISSGGFLRSLFGAGYNANIKFYGYDYSAHNDFLEIFMDYGIVGLIIYLSLMFELAKKCMENIKYQTERAVPCIMALCILLVLSIFSHLVLYPSYFILLIVFLTYIESNTQCNSIE